MEQEIKKTLDKIRPMLQQDGGDLEFVEYKDNILKVRLKGACSGCPMSQATLKNGVERTIKKEHPEVKSVENVGY